MEEQNSKVCTSCNIDKNISEYSMCGKSFRNRCNACMKISRIEKQPTKIKKEELTNKICTCCNIDKNISEYPTNGKSIRAKCKTCTNISKIIYVQNKQIVIPEINQMKQCTHCNIDKTLDMFHKSIDGLYGVKNICKICKKEIAKLHYNNNKEEILLEKKEFYKENKQVVIDRVKTYRKEKLSTDTHFRFIQNIRNLIRNAFTRKFTEKSKRTTEILGCSFEEFKIHLEKQFDSKMNWDNQGTYWHMDHIIPIENAVTIEDVIKLNHYTNFQPLYWEDNQSKGISLNYKRIMR